MKFMEEVLKENEEIWERWLQVPFLQKMINGTLEKKLFKSHLIQDSLYLRDYLKVFAYAMTKVNTLKDMKRYYMLLGYVDEGENATRIRYLNEFGLDDETIDTIERKKQCRAYGDFLNKIGKNGTEEEILMAMLPCMVGYRYVFEELKLQAPHLLEGYYAPLIQDYTTEEYGIMCDQWLNITERACSGLTDKQKEELKAIFKQASLHELYFWQMAGEEE